MSGENGNGSNGKKNGRAAKKNGKATGKQRKSNPCEHLKPHQWKKGQSGNPSGRAKGCVSLTKMIRETLSAETGGPSETAKELIRVGFEKALEGDFRFWEELVKRVDGRVLEQVVNYEGGPLVREVGTDISAVLAGRMAGGGDDE